MELPHFVVNPHETEKPWMTLVNGLFVGQSSWEQVIPSLTPFFRVLTYDGRGQGEGPRPLAPYRFDDLVDDLHELLKRLEIRRSHFLGLSQGGRIALKFAELYPERVTGVIACDTYAEVTPLLRLKIQSWLEAHRTGGALLRFDVAAPWIWSEEILLQRPDVYQFYRSRAGVEQPRVIERLIEAALDGAVRLERILPPVLYVVGKDDVLTPPCLHEKMRDRTRKARFCQVPGAHAALFESPESLENQILPDYLALLEQSQENPRRASNELQ